MSGQTVSLELQNANVQGSMTMSMKNYLRGFLVARPKQAPVCGLAIQQKALKIDCPPD